MNQQLTEIILQKSDGIASVTDVGLTRAPLEYIHLVLLRDGTNVPVLFKKPTSQEGIEISFVGERPEQSHVDNKCYFVDKDARYLATSKEIQGPEIIGVDIVDTMDGSKESLVIKKC